MWGYHWGWPGALWMGLGAIFWLILAVVAIWALARWLNRPSGPATPTQTQRGNSALDVLNERYARGEIDLDTYRSMRAEMERSTPSAQPPKEPLTT